MIKEPQFSFIVPVYNVAPYLRACLDSVLGQTFDGWEAVCVDDGSTDDSGGILDEYSAKDARIRVVRKKNGGLSDARNAGLAVARGRWIVFLDGDDVFAPDGLAVINCAISGNLMTDLIRFRIQKFEDGGMALWHTEVSYEARVLDVSSSITLAVSMFGLCEMAYRRELISGLRFVGRAYHEDRQFYAESLVLAKTIVDIGTPLYGYRMRSGSIIHTDNRFAETRRAIEVFPRILKLYLESGRHLDRRAERLYANYVFERIPFQIFGLNRALKIELWKLFWEQLKELNGLHGWHRIVCGLYRHSPFPEFTAFLLGALPYFAKMKGLHR